MQTHLSSRIHRKTGLTCATTCSNLPPPESGIRVSTLDPLVDHVANVIAKRHLCATLLALGHLLWMFAVVLLVHLAVSIEAGHDVA